MSLKINKVKKKIAKLLLKYPPYRDDDLKLIAQLWNDRMQKAIKTKYSTQEKATIKKFLTDMANGQYPHPESIMRCRRKLQELNIILRGRTWNKRHGIAQNEIQEELYDKSYEMDLKESKIKFK